MNPAAKLIALLALSLLCHQATAQTVPVSFTGGGTNSFDGWVRMNNSNPNFSGWPTTPAESNASGSGDAQLVRVSGSAIFATESLYFLSNQQVTNALGGTLRVSERSPVAGVKTITLQVQIGEALGYGFVQPSGVPVLKINDTASSLAPTYAKVVNSYQNGTYESPITGEEPVFVKTWAYQWNVGNLGTISSIQIDFSAVTHAQIYEMRLDQTSVLQTSNVFDVATPAPAISLSGSGLTFGNVVVGSSKTGTLTIRNNGNANLNVSGISYPSPALSGSWSGTIAAGGSQNITVTFAPTAATTLSGNIAVSSNDTVNPSTIAVSGTAIAQTRVLGLSGNLAFGNVTVGQATNRTLTISNSGNSTLTVSNIVYPQGFRGSWSNGIISLPTNAFTNITVTFSPTNAQAFSGSITVGANTTSGTNAIAASGTGTAVPTRLIGMPASLDFGASPVGGARTLTLTISNTGNSPLNVSNVSYPPAFSGETGGSIIASGGSRSISVTFTPSAAGGFSGTISVTSDKTAGGNTAAVAGIGSAPTIQQRFSGTPAYNGSFTTVTHKFQSTPATWLNIEYTDNLTDTNSWTPHSAPVYSDGGEFPVTFTKSGDHRTNWQRGMFFRLIYPTKP